MLPPRPILPADFREPERHDVTWDDVPRQGRGLPPAILNSVEGWMTAHQCPPSIRYIGKSLLLDDMDAYVFFKRVKESFRSNDRNVPRSENEAKQFESVFLLLFGSPGLSLRLELQGFVAIDRFSSNFMTTQLEERLLARVPLPSSVEANPSLFLRFLIRQFRVSLTDIKEKLEPPAARMEGKLYWNPFARRRGFLPAFALPSNQLEWYNNPQLRPSVPAAPASTNAGNAPISRPVHRVHSSRTESARYSFKSPI